MEKRTAIGIGAAMLVFSLLMGFYIVGPAIHTVMPKTKDKNVPPGGGTKEENVNKTTPNNNGSVAKETYLDFFSFDQSVEKLSGTALQYKISFHKNDTVRYDMDMAYHLQKAGAVFYLIYLTDGQNTTTLHLSAEASGSMTDITTGLVHLKIGKRADLSNQTSLSNTEQVTNGTVWYLVVAVANSIDNETMSVTIQTETDSMKVETIVTAGAVTLASAVDKQFKDGSATERYRGYSILGIGYNYCTASKKIPVSNGGILCVDMVNHISGDLRVGN